SHTEHHWMVCILIRYRTSVGQPESGSLAFVSYHRFLLVNSRFCGSVLVSISFQSIIHPDLRRRGYTSSSYSGYNDGRGYFFIFLLLLGVFSIFEKCHKVFG
ncbi:hypothetical protein Q9233_004099, partial [Columba guinea]